MPMLRVDEEVNVPPSPPPRRRVFNADLRVIGGRGNSVELWGCRSGSEVVVDVTMNKDQREAKVTLSHRQGSESLLLKRWVAVYEANSDKAKKSLGWRGTEEEFNALLDAQGHLRLHVAMEWADRKSSVRLQGIAAHFAQYLFSEELNDCVIVVGDVRIPAHKNVLAQSPFFKALWRSRMVEAESGAVELKEESEEDVRGLLSFLYQGDVSAASPWERSDLERRPLAYMALGDKYGLAGLKEAAVQAMIDQLDALSPETLCEAAEVAQELGLERLGRAAKRVVAGLVLGLPKALWDDLVKRNLAAAFVLCPKPNIGHRDDTSDESDSD